ncbi:hypothetical protein [Campylobacter corcagiensis]|uniref:Uncharacterized protein n=1 Tax=Campylobacter corcagiensis TaxID=1448857 RepID=A0A7M1LIQ6_9BACT|nr:hypothetical protein [Campylobacter corcagiensis]QKF63964.1 hypothetical protein CCORG_0066 [Campylobacter corcagiensis]QOQ87834.1 hypothetical protein IMC76_03255 [Campylobacter corcagiensis]
MERLSIADAAQKLGISKEAIYNRIRRQTIQSEEIDGVKYVLLSKDDNKTTTNTKSQKSSKNDKDFIDYLKGEIEYLKLKISSLQGDKEKLYQEKEQILTNTKDEIKAIYNERDEKLKYFLSLLEKPMLAKTDKIEAIEVKTAQDKKSEKKWLSLKDFLDTLDLKKKERKEIKKLIIKEAYDSEFIKIEAGMIFIDKNFEISTLIKDDNEKS